MRLRITAVDSAPDDLPAQIPFEAELLREIPGPDRPDYWLARLAEPIEWAIDGRRLRISHLVFAARLSGSRIEAGIRRLPVGIAYVTDPSLLDDDALDFDKCQYVAIGSVDDAAGESA